MSIQVKTQDLARALKTLRVVPPVRTPMPITRHVHFDAAKGGQAPFVSGGFITRGLFDKPGRDRLTLAATDLEVTASITLPCDCAEEAAGTFDLRAVLAFAESTAGALEISLQDREVTLTAGSRSLRTHSFDPAEFPLAEPLIGEAVPFKHCLDAVAKVLPFTLKEEERPVFSGVWFRGREIAASDAHRLMLFRVDAELPVCVVPRRACEALLEYVRNYSPAGLAFVPGEERAAFTAPGFTLAARLIPGTIPDYDAAFPCADPVRRVTIRVRDALQALKMHHETVILVFAGDKVELTSQGEEHAVKTFAPCRCDGAEPFTIAFNTHYLRQMFAAYGDKESLVLNYYAPLAPIIVDAGDQRSITLPLRHVDGPAPQPAPASTEGGEEGATGNHDDGAPGQHPDDQSAAESQPAAL